MKQEGTAMKKGFTLVELLVVITILGILMAMMVPAAGIILKRAKVAQAKSDASVVASVMLKYRSEYNRWPFFSTNNATQQLTDNVWVDAMGPEPSTPFQASNPKRIVFFQPGAGALDDHGAFVDPWGHSFEYQLDIDGDGQMPDPAGLRPTPIAAAVLVWSAGPDGDYASFGDNAKSWE